MPFNKARLASGLKKAAVAVAAVGMSVGTAVAGSLDSATVTALQTSVTEDVNTAGTSGFAVMTVSLGLSIGMGLLSKFISKGARG
ncbi:hypothetical protein [Gallaecimonas pentaromativorans]|uniref:Major coat protein n=1 Tax=Gallaecimonas pentaromativorans TaxID=584787 RepID=A0A3N1P8A0_9GAMM|nr:hypothetical protein [Gallaecimonas pentaromativorans]ROQ27582.1 hypothetical protein EDC28_104233 [Gallaecimonas pentaromativorans]